MLKKGASGGIYIHPWDITDEGIDNCYDYLEHTCGLNELFVAAAYHSGTFILPHNPKRIVRWDHDSIYFTPQHPAWRHTRIKPVIGDCVDSAGYMGNIVDKARQRDWGVIFFTVFHFSHSIGARHPEVCCVDAMGERQRSYLCPANPDVRAYDLAIAEELMGTYGGDGIRHESLGFGSWNYIPVVNKVETMPAPRDQALMSLCFCGSCMQRAKDEGCDPVPLRRAICDHLYDSLPRDPAQWDIGPADQQWARAAFEGKLWPYLEVRCNTVTSLFEQIQQIINRYDGAFVPCGLSNERNVMGAMDHSKFYPHMKRVSLGTGSGSLDEMQKQLAEQVEAVPDWAEPEIMHNQRDFDSTEALRDRVLMTRRAGVRHHAFHYYGMSRHHELERIGHARQAWE